MVILRFENSNDKVICVRARERVVLTMLNFALKTRLLKEIFAYCGSLMITMITMILYNVYSNDFHSYFLKRFLDNIQKLVCFDNTTMIELRWKEIKKRRSKSYGPVFLEFLTVDNGEMVVCKYVDMIYLTLTNKEGNRIMDSKAQPKKNVKSLNNIIYSSIILIVVIRMMIEKEKKCLLHGRKQLLETSKQNEWSKTWNDWDLSHVLFQGISTKPVFLQCHIAANKVGWMSWIIFKIAQRKWRTWALAHVIGAT